MTQTFPCFHWTRPEGSSERSSTGRRASFFLIRCPSPTGINGATGTRGLAGLPGLLGLAGLWGLAGLGGLVRLRGLLGLEGLAALLALDGLLGLIALLGLEGLLGLVALLGLEGLPGLPTLFGLVWLLAGLGLPSPLLGLGADVEYRCRSGAAGLAAIGDVRSRYNEGLDCLTYSAVSVGSDRFVVGMRAVRAPLGSYAQRSMTGGFFAAAAIASSGLSP